MLDSGHGRLWNTISACSGCRKMLLPTHHLQTPSDRGPSSLCLLEVQLSCLLITLRGQIENTRVASIGDRCEDHMWQEKEKAQC